MPQVRHEMSTRERKDLAFSMFARGMSNTDVKIALGVSRHTVMRYRAEYEEEIQDQAVDNPHLLRDVLTNTIRMLRELDEAKAEAWSQYELAVHPATKQGYLNSVVKIQDQRAKLLGLFGVKAEYMAYVANVKTVQDKMIAWMREHLCEVDRRELEEFMATALAPYMGDALPAIPVESGLRTVS